MEVTADHLDELATAIQTGWDRRAIERRAAPVLYAFDRVRPGGRQEDFIDFLDEVVRRIASEPVRTPAAAIGAILWYEAEVRIRDDALRPLLQPDRLGQLLSDPEWPALANEWQRRYGFPTPSQRGNFGVERSQAYDYLRQGKARIAEVLNDSLMAREHVRVSDAHGWSRVIRALQYAFEHSPDLGDHALSAIYVPPTLKRTSSAQRAAPIGSEQTLVEWIDQDRIVLITGGAGSGKSTLLRHLGWLMLQQDKLAVWLEPGERVASIEDLIARLIEQTGVTYSAIQQALLSAGQSKRLQLLVDGGEVWTRSQVRSVLALRARLDAGLIVAARQPQHWVEVEHERVEIVWNRRDLHEIMARRGQTQLWSSLATMLNEHRLLLRPWEFVQAAQVSLNTAAGPVAFLEAALQAQIEAHAIAPKTLNAWLSAAWQTVAQARLHWRPVHAADKSKANQAVEARLMVKDHEGYRFAHDLWRDFLAARYAARQPSAREVVNNLVGLTDWPQILAWAVQSAWDDGRPEWATEALQVLAGVLESTWQQSGWLQGALVFAAQPSRFMEIEEVKSIRAVAERALIEQTLSSWLTDPAATPRSMVGESLGQALLALVPLSNVAVETLWQRLFIGRSHKFMDPLTEALLREPSIAQRVLNTPGDLPQEQTYTYVEELAHAPGLQPEELIEHVRRFFLSGAEQFTAVVAGLVAQGTPASASALVSYLSELRDDEQIECAYRLEPFLKKWQGETDVLWLQAVRLFDQAVSSTVAHHFVLNLFAADPVGATRLDAEQRDRIQRLIERSPHDLSEEQREVVERLEREREYYLIQQRLAAAETEVSVPHEEDVPTLLQGLLEEDAFENVELLHQFPAEAIDAVLKQWSLDRSRADRLARLGTPHAIQQLLAWSHVEPNWLLGVDVRYPSPRYRDAIWPLLAQAAEAESSEQKRYHFFSAIDIIWLESSTWPWPLVEFFFDHSDDADKDVADKYTRTLRQKARGRELSAAWAGLPDDVLAIYVAGLVRYVTHNPGLKQLIALEFLTAMPTAVAGSALTHARLIALSKQDLAVQHLALEYIGMHERRDLLNRLRAMADTEDMPQLESETRRSLAWALGRIGEAKDIARLLRFVRQTDMRWAALAEMLNQRRYWPGLWAAIKNDAAEANWLTAAVVRQGVILEDNGQGGLYVRAGAERERVGASHP